MESTKKIEDFIVVGEHDTYFTPEVKLDVEQGQGSITGESYLENSFEFYDGIIEWFKNYFDSGNTGFTLNIKLLYFNTSSSRALLDMFRFLKSQEDAGKQIIVNWHYPNPDDSEMQLEAEDFIEESGLDLTLIEYEAEED